MRKYIINDKTKKLKALSKNNISNSCPFCKSNRQVAMEDGVYLLDDKHGHMLIPNKYTTYPEYNIWVIVEMYSCDRDLQDYTIQEMYDYYLFVKESLKIYHEHFPHNKEIMLVKQVGTFSGGSVKHGHSQILGTKENKIDNNLVYEKIQLGHSIYNRDGLNIRFNNEPLNDRDEFIIEYSDSADIQHMLSKLKILLNNVVKPIYNELNYSLSYHRYNNTNYIKLLPRTTTSTLLLHFDVPFKNLYTDEELTEYTNLLED